MVGGQRPPIDRPLSHTGRIENLVIKLPRGPCPLIFPDYGIAATLQHNRLRIFGRRANAAVQHDALVGQQMLAARQIKLLKAQRRFATRHIQPIDKRPADSGFRASAELSTWARVNFGTLRCPH